MPTEFLLPVDNIENNWDAGDFTGIDDPHATPDDGDFLTDAGSGAAVWRGNVQDLNGGESGITQVTNHGRGRRLTPAGNATPNSTLSVDLDVTRVLQNDYAFSSFTTLTNASTTNPTTGAGWTIPEINQMQVRVRRGGEFGIQSRVTFAHADVDTELGGQAPMEIIGACWLPPLIAAGLGGLLLRSEDKEKLQAWLNAWWPHRHELPRPILKNDLEWEWFVDRLMVRPVFVF